MNKPALVTALSLLIGGCSNPDLLNNWFPEQREPADGFKPTGMTDGFTAGKPGEVFSLSLAFENRCDAGRPDMGPSDPDCIINNGTWIWSRRNKETNYNIKADVSRGRSLNEYCLSDPTDSAQVSSPTYYSNSEQRGSEIPSGLLVHVPLWFAEKKLMFKMTAYTVLGAIIIGGEVVGGSPFIGHSVWLSPTSREVKGDSVVVKLDFKAIIEGSTSTCVRITGLDILYQPQDE